MQNNINASEIDTIVSLILKSARTEAEVGRVLNIIKLFLEQYYFVETGEKTFEENVKRVKDVENVTETDLTLLRQIHQYKSSSFKQESFYKALDDLAKALYSLPRVTLHVPIRLDGVSRERIGAWVQTNISPTVLVSIRVNPLLVAGCGIGWNSQYMEFSMDEKIKNNKDQLFSLLPKL